MVGPVAHAVTSSIKGTRHCHALSVMRDSGVSPSGFLYDTMPAPGDGGMGSEGAYLIISATA